MKQSLAPVAAELALWRGTGLTLPLWWRDDDAVEPTFALDRLLATARRFEAPLHLAVIPEPAVPELAGALGGAPVHVLPHGWRHRNHAPAGQKKAEYGAHRPVGEMLTEIDTAWRRLRDLFGEQALGLFTPPWNRVSGEVAEGLSGLGLKGLSTFGPRPAAREAGVAVVNTHLDPIDWHRGRRLLEPSLLGEQMVRDLRARRLGDSDASEPFGLLTHHLVHEEATWSFLESLLEVLAESSAARWTPPLATHQGRTATHRPRGA